VFTLAGDPVGSGLVTSLARPGGNVTGLSLQMPDALTKRLELLREFVPGLRRLTILANVGNLVAVQEMRSVQEVAGTLGIEADAVGVGVVAVLLPHETAPSANATTINLSRLIVLLRECLFLLCRTP
jgi:putative ABC transport system substrate-binding protein